MDFKTFFYKITPSERERAAMQKYQQGVPVMDIVQEFGFTSVGRFYEMLRENGVPANRLRQKHELIDYFHNGGYSTHQIADLVNMSERAVRDVVRKLRD